MSAACKRVLLVSAVVITALACSASFLVVRMLRTSTPGLWVDLTPTSAIILNDRVEDVLHTLKLDNVNRLTFHESENPVKKSGTMIIRNYEDCNAIGCRTFFVRYDPNGIYINMIILSEGRIFGTDTFTICVENSRGYEVYHVLNEPWTLANSSDVINCLGWSTRSLFRLVR